MKERKEMGRTSNFSLLWEFLRFARRYLLPKQVHQQERRWPNAAYWAEAFQKYDQLVRSGASTRVGFPKHLESIKKGGIVACQNTELVALVPSGWA
ncbi:hypothetical protein A0257_22770 (plasmid) [Hymenobacter psoromatis]|nr:hypothetical protein A0257_22770 [Hymenobacter psoromatis]